MHTKRSKTIAVHELDLLYSNFGPLLHLIAFVHSARVEFMPRELAKPMSLYLHIVAVCRHDVHDLG